MPALITDRCLAGGSLGEALRQLLRIAAQLRRVTPNPVRQGIAQGDDDRQRTSALNGDAADERPARDGMGALQLRASRLIAVGSGHRRAANGGEYGAHVAHGC
jgi:hypothetical protein